jgi:hypothetical protein
MTIIHGHIHSYTTNKGIYPPRAEETLFKMAASQLSKCGFNLEFNAVNSIEFIAIPYSLIYIFAGIHVKNTLLLACVIMNVRYQKGRRRT